LGELQINFNFDYATLNQSRWRVPSFQKTDFQFEVESYTRDLPYWDNVNYSVNYYNMGTTNWFKANATSWGEWGYSFHHLTGGVLDGAGVQHFGGYPTPPETKKDAYEYMRQYVMNFTTYLNNNTRPWVSFNGHYPYHHYAGEFGFDAIGTEIGENMESYQMLMAFNRGAARQYNLPWFVDVSAWYGAGITDYNEPTLWKDYGGADRGHSLSLYRRSYYMAYMAGTSRLIAEGGSGNYFYLYDNVDPSGLMQLTPLGEIGREIAHFAQKNPNRGIAYNPIGIIIDKYHGTTGFATKSLFGTNKAFNSIPYSKGDEMTYNLLDILFPGGWINNDDEKCQLVNNEFGDIFDILLQNVAADVLASYPVLLMSGEIILEPAERERLIEYVQNGGTLIVNSAYFEQFNECLKARGSDLHLQLPFAKFVNTIQFPTERGGNFILYGPAYSTALLTPILRELQERISPFIIKTSQHPFGQKGAWGAQAHIQYLLNRNENGWILTLINNDGVTKSPLEAPHIDAKQWKNIEISLNSIFLARFMKDRRLNRINDWTGEKTIWNPEDQGIDFEKMAIRLDPGEVLILEFEFA
jgi:hypothetical protein